MKSSIYLHIPYCKQACSYCDFHFSTNLTTRENVLDHMLKEMDKRSILTPWNQAQIVSIYFGGGTPSLLESEEIERILQHIHSSFEDISSEVEITLEVNPDDITTERLERWYRSSINRLSVGIQSFDGGELSASNRAHTNEESHQVLQWISESDFENYSVDLIYGMPGSTTESWQKNLKQLEKYSPPHMSCYALSVEENTVLASQVKKGTTILPREEVVLEQYQQLGKWAQAQGYEHYELSNYSKPGKRSAHNQHYWSYQPYLGIGPGAHSFDGKLRFWNVSNNNLYTQGAAITEEELTVSEQLNERLMVRLRTADGFRYSKDLPQLGLDNAHEEAFRINIDAGLRAGVIAPINDGFRILPENWMTSDAIIAGLMIDHDDED
ncbi:MAG TPA: coproporphyrinogen III oxidase [Cryomorphaceae bacterium]|nr:coproporphyrinogen III oxidase [Cryomorphaceae bacterium]